MCPFAGQDQRCDPSGCPINAYYYSENWKNDESIKNKLLSIKRGDEITLKGLFGGPKVFAYYNGFEVIEILD